MHLNFRRRLAFAVMAAFVTALVWACAAVSYTLGPPVHRALGVVSSAASTKPSVRHIAVSTTIIASAATATIYASSSVMATILASVVGLVLLLVVFHVAKQGRGPVVRRFGDFANRNSGTIFPETRRMSVATMDTIDRLRQHLDFEILKRRLDSIFGVGLHRCRAMRNHRPAQPLTPRLRYADGSHGGLRLVKANV